MSDNVVPAGWYGDPNDASRLRWWDGTNWQDHFAPAVPPAPVVVAPVGPAANIPAPVLNDVSPADQVRAAEATPDERISVSLMDHAKYVAANLAGKNGARTRPIPPLTPSGSAPAPTITDHTANFVGDPRVPGGAMGAAGVAPAAGGAASSARKDGSSRKKPKMLLVGLIIFIVGVCGLISGIAQAITGPTEATTNGQVTKIQLDSFGQCIPTVEFQVQGETQTTRPDEFATCTWEVGDSTEVTYTVSSGGTVARLGTATDTGSVVSGAVMLMVAGFIVSVWALVPVILRAGSIAGWAYLIRRDQRSS